MRRPVVPISTLIQQPDTLTMPDAAAHTGTYGRH
jgi:hypothetical protein